MEREKNEKGSSYAPPMQRGQQQYTRAYHVRQAESMPLDGRIANARHLSDAGLAQARGTVPQRSVEDIIAPSNNSLNKKKGDLPEAKDVRLQGFKALVDHGILSKKSLVDYEKVDARVREIEADTSLTSTQKGTQLDAVRSDYLKRNDPRGFQDRMPVRDLKTGGMKQFVRQDHKTNDMLDLSPEARKRNALIFDEVTSAGGADVKNAKAGTSIPGVSGFKAGSNDAKGMLADIAKHDPEMDAESWAGAAEIAKEEGYTPSRPKLKKAKQVDSHIAAWEKDAVRISDIISSHSEAVVDSVKAGRKSSENLVIIGDMEVAAGKGQIVTGEDNLESKLDKTESVSDNPDYFAGSTSAESSPASFIKKEALHESRKQVVAQDRKVRDKRLKVASAAKADAAMHLPEFRKLHPAGTERDFVKFMAQKSLASPHVDTNPFAVERVNKELIKEYKIHAGGDYETVHRNISDAIGSEGGLGKLASQYSQTEILQLEDNDLHNAREFSRKSAQAAEEARVAASLIDPKDPRRASAIKDHEEMVRFADNKANAFEVMKLRHKQSTGKPWEGSDRNFQVETNSSHAAEVKSAEDDLAHHQAIYDDPSVGWSDRKKAREEIKKAQFRLENSRDIAKLKAAGSGDKFRPSTEDGLQHSLAIAAMPERNVPASKGLRRSSR